MKPYGLTRRANVEWPDVADIHAAGFKSCVGSVRGKGGDYRSNQQPKKKRAIRRIWKKLARRISKALCRRDHD